VSDKRPTVTLRLAVLAFVSVLVPIAGVAQVRILGVNADLAPAGVAAAGFLTGAAARERCSGFGRRHLRRPRLRPRPLGSRRSSNVLVGYGAGRVRELRRPRWLR